MSRSPQSIARAIGVCLISDTHAGPCRGGGAKLPVNWGDLYHQAEK
jgi:hypothetical protein